MMVLRQKSPNATKRRSARRISTYQSSGTHGRQAGLNNLLGSTASSSSGIWRRLLPVGPESVDDLLRHRARKLVEDYLAHQIFPRNEFQIPWSMIVHFQSYPCNKSWVNVRRC